MVPCGDTAYLDPRLGAVEPRPLPPMIGPSRSTLKPALTPLSSNGAIWKLWVYDTRSIMS